MLDIPIRHLVGAAYMAWEEKAKYGEGIKDEFSEKLSEQLIKEIKQRAPKGNLSLRTKQGEDYLCNLADQYFDRPFLR